VQAFILILAYPYGISLSAYQVVWWRLEYVHLPTEEFGSCLVHHAVRLFALTDKVDVLAAGLKNYNIYIAGIRRLNTLIGLNT